MLHRESTDVVLKAAGITANHVIYVKLRTRRPLTNLSTPSLFKQESTNHLEFQYRRHLFLATTDENWSLTLQKVPVVYSY
jgi:hypothetical protein